MAAALLAARRPLVVTSYLGRNPQAVGELVRLCRRLGVGVVESVPYHVNYPADDPLHQGSQWSEPAQNPVLAEADLVLILDSDVPWIPMANKPNPTAAVFHIDIDPLKQQTPLWYFPALRSFAADAATALAQLNARLDQASIDPAAVEQRLGHYAARHAARHRQLAERERPHNGTITPAYLSARLRAHLDADTIVLSEGITNYQTIFDHLGLSRPGSLVASGGSSLGWNGGAAIGAKLANPDKTVVALTGDGSFLFTVPATVHWMARRYRVPFLQIVFNNGGWNGPKCSTLAVHPDGYASRDEDIGVSFDPQPDYGAIAAAAGGAWTRRVTQPDQLDAALADALTVLREEGRAAVLDVQLAHI